jgi:hypothetical protein
VSTAAKPALITPAEKKAVRLIKENTHGLSEVLVAPAAYGRWAVVVRNVITRKRVGAISDRTLSDLKRHGLVKVTSEQTRLQDYKDRRHLDSLNAYKVSLTENGSAL